MEYQDRAKRIQAKYQEVYIKSKSEDKAWEEVAKYENYYESLDVVQKQNKNSVQERPFKNKNMQALLEILKHSKDFRLDFTKLSREDYKEMKEEADNIYAYITQQYYN